MSADRHSRAMAVGIALMTLTGCVAVPPGPPPPAAYPHPAIAAAQAHIQNAAEILRDRAASDFGGHKAAALRWLAAADQQLQEGKAYANRPQ
ncbi:hypothetical protein [Acidithiobacillus caldus]|uniref:hypothetical protein n=2 Tax=Acidithiobacillus caldus TaxID=33059 RepID=UPI001D029E28|nr:hypothetical protein [Acidithiobacillus caldus]